MQKDRNRWLIALAAVGIHICIGSVYAWSVLTKPIMQELGVNLKDTQWTFSLAILFLGTSAAFLGGFVERHGPRRSGLVSTFFFCTGLLGASWAIEMRSLNMLYLFYGVIGGIGLGTGYITPVSTLVSYVPEKRGFATGIAIMGFGFASMIAAPLYQVLLESYGLTNTFRILSAIYFVAMLASALYLRPPARMSALVKSSKTDPITGVVQKSAKEALHSWQFYVLWWMLFTNITCGIGLLSVASPMAQEVINMSPIVAAAMVGIIGVLNGLGRFVWASISDYFGRANTYITFFLIQIAAFFLLANTTNSIVFQLLIYLIITCYGGGFSAMPAFLSDIFGTKEISSIHGKILTAWAAAGIVGPLTVSWVWENSHSYSATMLLFSACFVVALPFSIFLKIKQAKTRKESTVLREG